MGCFSDIKLEVLIGASCDLIILIISSLLYQGAWDFLVLIPREKGCVSFNCIVIVKNIGWNTSKRIKGEIVTILKIIRYEIWILGIYYRIDKVEVESKLSISS